MTPHPSQAWTAGSVERQLGWIVSLAGLVLLIGDSSGFARASTGHPLWLEITGYAVAGIVIVLALLGRILPARMLVVLWLCVPGLLAVLSLTAYLPADPAVPITDPPWTRTLEPLMAIYVALALRPLPAIATTVIVAILPAVSALVFVGEVPTNLAVKIPLYISNLGYTIVFIGLRRMLGRLHEIEQASREAEQKSAEMLAEAHRRRRLATIVHDSVLSVFSAALTLRVQTDELRREADDALRQLRAIASDTAATSAPSGSPVDAARARLLTRWRDIDPLADADLDIGAGDLPADVVAALEEAGAEVLRNSLRHAGPDARRRISGRVSGDATSVRIIDDGRGFAEDDIPDERLGVRRSIIGRLVEVGGAADVSSALGAGTEVTLRWPQ